MKNEYINKWQTTEVFTQMVKIEKGKEIRDTLIAYARKKGVNAQDSEMLADQIMSGVYTYEDTREKLETNAADALAPLFQKLSGMPLKDQALVLDQIIFAFETMGDDTLFEKAANENAGAVARRGAAAGTAGEVEALKAKLLDRVQHIQISPRAMDAIVSNMEKSGDCTAAAAALGRKGYALKCVTAMMLHLDSAEGANVSKSVAAVCAGVDIQALGDAVDRGLMARKIANVVLTAVVCAVLICWAVTNLDTMVTVLSNRIQLTTSFHSFLTYLAPELGFYLAMVGGFAMMVKLKDVFADLTGQLTILLTSQVNKDKDRAVNGLKAVASYAAENSRATDAAGAVEEPDPDWDLNGDPDRAF